MGELAIFGVKAWWRKTSSIHSSPSAVLTNTPGFIHHEIVRCCVPLFPLSAAFGDVHLLTAAPLWMSVGEEVEVRTQLRVRTMAHFEWLSNLFQNMCFFGFHKKAFFFTLPNVRTNAEISRHLQLQLAIFEWFQCFKVPSFTHITGYGIPELPAGVKQLGKNLRNAARGRVESLRVWQGLGRVTHHRSCRNLYQPQTLFGKEV